MLEQYHFTDVTIVYPSDINAGKLKEKYDVILFIGAGIPAQGSSGGKGVSETDRKQVPGKYHHMLGSITTKHAIPRLREFMEAGGTVLTVNIPATLSFSSATEVTDSSLTAPADVILAFPVAVTFRIGGVEPM